MLLGSIGGSTCAACFPRKPDRKALGPASPEADRSLCRDDCAAGGGGKAGDIGIAGDGELRAERSAGRGDAVNLALSSMGDLCTAC